MDALLTKRNTLVAIALLVLWKIYLSATLQLHLDEAYYWLWSRHLLPMLWIDLRDSAKEILQESPTVFTSPSIQGSSLRTFSAAICAS